MTGAIVKQPALHWQILIGLCLGIVAGLLSRIGGYEAALSEAAQFVGGLFLRLLRMVILPLIGSSVIASVAGIGSGSSFGRIGLKTFAYYLASSFFAVITGLFLVNSIKPGAGADLSLSSQNVQMPAATASISEMLISVIPTNPLEAMVKGDIIQVIFFSILFGFFIGRSPDSCRVRLQGFFQDVFDVMMRLTQFIIRFAPLGVGALLADTVSSSGLDVFLPLGRYMITVALGLMVHAVVTLPVLLACIGIRPAKMCRAVSAALLTAFSTASSSATLPITMDSVRRNAGVSTRITSFVLPLGATVNMDGTALYECVAALFIAQAYGIELSIQLQAVVVLTALFASVGAAGVPMAGLVMISIILKAVGLPLEGIGMILAVDRVLDMMRTAVNVWSDSCGTVLVARTEGEQLRV